MKNIINNVEDVHNILLECKITKHKENPNGQLWFNGVRASVWKSERLLEVDVGNAVHTVVQIALNCKLKMVDFMFT